MLWVDWEGTTGEVTHTNHDIVPTTRIRGDTVNREPQIFQRPRLAAVVGRDPIQRAGELCGVDVAEGVGAYCVVEEVGCHDGLVEMWGDDCGEGCVCAFGHCFCEKVG